MADTPAAPGSNESANTAPSQLPQEGNQSTLQTPQMMAYQQMDSNFTPKQSEYQPMPGTPPSYYSGQVPPSHGQQSGSNVVVVQQQPTIPQMAMYAPRNRPVGDHYLIFSIITTVLSVVCFCCHFPVFLCTIPALVLSIMAQDDDRNGFMDSAQTKAKAALGLNIAAVVVVVLIWITIVTGLVLNFVVFAAAEASVAASQQ